jgi:hypothetical protein
LKEVSDMNRVTAFVFGIATVLASLAPLGCGGGGDKGGGGRGGAGGDPAAFKDLKHIGMAFHNYNDKYRGKGPPNADALKEFLEGDTPAYRGLKDGRYVFVWNARLLDNIGEPPAVLAYQKDVPSQGGVVLFVNIETRHMTPDEFKSARLAKAKP